MAETSGCGGGGACGIQAQREAERRRVLALLRRLHPDGTCQGAVLEDVVRAGLDLDDCAGLAARIEDVLPVRVFRSPAGSTELGDSLYVLAGIHEPCLFELREGACPRGAEPVRTHETYLRVALSPLGRFASLQETHLDLQELGDGARLVIESPAVGVVDRDLRMLVTGLQGMLRRESIVLLDFAFLMQPFGEAGDPVFTQRWETTPTLWNVLFDPAPPSTTREVVV